MCYDCFYFVKSVATYLCTFFILFSLRSFSQIFSFQQLSLVLLIWPNGLRPPVLFNSSELFSGDFCRHSLVTSCDCSIWKRTTTLHSYHGYMGIYVSFLLVPLAAHFIESKPQSAASSLSVSLESLRFVLCSPRSPRSPSPRVARSYSWIEGGKTKWWDNLSITDNGQLLQQHAFSEICSKMQALLHQG